MAAPYTKTSPSQISNYEMCPRRWYYSSIERRPQPQFADAAAGERLHKQRENWQLFGTEPEHPSVALTKDWTAPPKTEGIIIEAKTTGLEIAGLAINGRVDFTDGRDPTHPIIIDWKSKGNLKAIPKTERGLKPLRETLSIDLQLNVYGAWAFVKYPAAENVSVGHGYISRDAENPGAKLVMTPPLSKAHVDGVITNLTPSLDGMKRDSQCSDAADVEARTSACWAFGQRCPFWDFCPKVEVSFSDLFTDAETDVTLLETLKLSPGAADVPDPAKFVGTVSATPVPVTVETDASVPEVAEATSDILSQLRGL